MMMANPQHFWRNDQEAIRSGVVRLKLNEGLDCPIWLGHPCSDAYKIEVAPICSLLSGLRERTMDGFDLNQADSIINRPFLQAFKEELERLSGTVLDIPAKMISTLLESGILGHLKKVPDSFLPNRLVAFWYDFDQESVLNLCLDKGWQLAFSVQTSMCMTEPSLDLEIRIVGKPSALHWIIPQSEE